MTTDTMERPAFSPHWEYIGWFAFIHTMVVVSVFYGFQTADNNAAVTFGPIHSSFSWWTVGVAALLWLYGHLSITCGVHRFFTHQAFKAKAWLQWVWLFGFSSVVQASARWWVGKHRRHHDEADTEGDPHWIGRGFFWSHMQWTCDREAIKPEPAKYTAHLKKDRAVWRRIQFQHKYYYLLAGGFGFILPMLVCWVGWNDPIGGLLIGGFARLVFQYHTTWLANSQAHMFGSRPFQSGGTATAQRWVGLLLNVGESTNHSYHHAVPWDWRLEPKISWFNPGTWVLWVCAKTGQIWDLKEASPERVRAYAHAH